MGVRGQPGRLESDYREPCKGPGDRTWSMCGGLGVIRIVLSLWKRGSGSFAALIKKTVWI